MTFFECSKLYNICLLKCAISLPEIAQVVSLNLPAKISSDLHQLMVFENKLELLSNQDTCEVVDFLKNYYPSEYISTRIVQRILQIHYAKQFTSNIARILTTIFFVARGAGVKLNITRKLLETVLSFKNKRLNNSFFKIVMYSNFDLKIRAEDIDFWNMDQFIYYFDRILVSDKHFCYKVLQNLNARREEEKFKKYRQGGRGTLFDWKAIDSFFIETLSTFEVYKSVSSSKVAVLYPIKNDVKEQLMRIFPNALHTICEHDQQLAQQIEEDHDFLNVNDFSKVVSPVGLFCMLRANHEFIVTTEIVAECIVKFESFVYLDLLLDHNMLRKQQSVKVTAELLYTARHSCHFMMKIFTLLRYAYHYSGIYIKFNLIDTLKTFKQRVREKTTVSDFWEFFEVDQT